jgi:hypothetical protein
VGVVIAGELAMVLMSDPLEAYPKLFPLWAWRQKIFPRKAKELCIQTFHEPGFNRQECFAKSATVMEPGLYWSF